jgi:hypothetical protein
VLEQQAITKLRPRSRRECGVVVEAVVIIHVYFHRCSLGIKVFATSISAIVRLMTLSISCASVPRAML